LVYPFEDIFIFLHSFTISCWCILFNYLLCKCRRRYRWKWSGTDDIAPPSQVW